MPTFKAIVIDKSAAGQTCALTDFDDTVRASVLPPPFRAR
jgi:hypothetical protein